MTPRIYSGAEARVLREVATMSEDDAARLAAAAPDLAASVVHHAERARRRRSRYGATRGRGSRQEERRMPHRERCNGDEDLQR